MDSIRALFHSVAGSYTQIYVTQMHSTSAILVFLLTKRTKVRPSNDIFVYRTNTMILTEIDNFNDIHLNAVDNVVPRFDWKKIDAIGF